MSFSVISDVPAVRDLLDFGRYCDPLIELISSDCLQTPLTIGIFGPWGSGKSTLLKMIERRLRSFDDRFLCVNFNPWVFRRESNLLIPLLHTLHDAIKSSQKGRFRESAARIADVLFHLSADVMVRSVTMEKVSLDQLHRYEKAYLERKGLFQSQLRNLREALQVQANALHEAGVEIVLLIDDLDRCQPCEIVDLLESVKLFLDIEHMLHILAVDKEVIDQGIELKYREFKLSSTRKAALGAEYLEKLIQIPVNLFPLHELQIKSFIRAHNLGERVADQIELLAGGLSPNPRKIKRVLNAIAITEQVLLDQDVDWSLVVSLAILRVEHPDLYHDVARMPSLLIALQNVYGRLWNVNDLTDYVKDFGDQAALARELSLVHYKPESTLAKLFAVNFSGARDRLTEYISVVGGR